MRLHYQASGTGKPVVLLHGLFGSQDNWTTVARALTGKFQVITVDQRNHGSSPHSPTMSYAEMAGDLRELLDTEGLRQAHIVGHSMGGKTGMEFALLHPEQTASLIVEDIAPKAYPPWHREIINVMLGLQPEGFRSLSEIDQQLASQIPERRVRQFLLKNVRRDGDGTLHWQLGLQELASNYEVLSGPVQTNGIYRGPALFVRGEQSDYVLDSDAEEITRRFPAARVTTLRGAGHWAHAEAPAEFIAAVEAFLSKER